MAKVSLVMATYNQADYIRTAVDSALAQDYKDVEIVVIDDGSSDHTRQVLEDYIDRGKILYKFQENGGKSNARNKGIALSAGEYIKFLDSDDFLYPQNIAQQVHNLEQSRCDISLCDFEFLYVDGSSKKVKVNLSKKDQFASFVHSPRGPLHGFLLKRSLLDRFGGFDPQMETMEDHELWMRLIFHGAKVVKVDEVGCCYRLLNSGLALDKDHLFRGKCDLFEKINAMCLNEPELISSEAALELWWMNMRLVHKCILMRHNVKERLSNTIPLMQKLYNSYPQQFSPIVKYMGIYGYTLINYLRYSFLDRKYMVELNNEEIMWRFSDLERANKLGLE